MKKGKTRILSLLTALVLCVSLLPTPASAADENGVTVWNDAIGGSTARLVTVAMTPGRTGVVSLANNSIVEAASARSIIDAENARGRTVVAAINGGFFNSYTSGAPVFPSSCPLIMNAVVRDGQLIHTGNTAALGFTADGKPMVDWVTLKAYVDLGMSSGFTPGTWSVNTLETDPEAIMLFDEHLTLPVNIPSSSTMFYIENGRITRAVPGATLTVPAGTQVLVYNSGIVSIEQGYGRLPEVGMPARVIIRASGTSRDGEWSNVREALVGGPLLVKDGASVVDDSRNSSYYGDPKQKPDVVQTRSFVGVTSSGALVMGTVSSSFRKIADWMVANGVQEGLAMDGGASSMLYANGSFVTPAGRNLASVLAIVDEGTGTQAPSTPSTPSDPGTPGASGGAPSSWAAAEVQNAVNAGLVPQDMQVGYQEPITRQDFCRLIWTMLAKQPGCAGWLQSGTPVTFTDTYNEAVLNCARLAIVSGVDNDGRFAPYNQLKRSEAAKILALTTQRLGVADTGAKFSAFTDRNTFGWAEQFIDYCGVNGIMSGDNGAFDPSGTFSREQAILTICRIYNQHGAK